jgi:hypothetical protein
MDAGIYNMNYLGTNIDPNKYLATLSAADHMLSIAARWVYCGKRLVRLASKP